MAWLWTFSLALSLIYGPLARAREIQFPRGTLKIQKKIVEIEIAESEEEHQHGLMFRKSLADGKGMLFIFPDEQRLGFWMKNTLIDLSIGYFDKSKKLVDIQEMKSPSVLEEYPPSYPSKVLAMYALEAPAGWFKRNGIKEGATFSFERNKEKGRDNGLVSKKSRRKSGP